jgi:hypothetical protein
MEELVKKLEVLAIKHGKEFAKEALVECAFPALEIAAKASATPWDDAALAALEQPLKDALVSILDKLGA